MKAYILNIEMLDITPLIWRKVIMPADATFQRLHQVIQHTTNFRDEHLYEFDFREQENMIVTNNKEAYNEHKHFLKNKKVFEEDLANTPDEYKDMAKRRIDLLNTIIRQPQTIKIDNYLEKYEAFHYLYDFGDGWQFSIELEQVVDDYYFGYPRLLDGAEAAPPEDVGGIPGYEHFKEAYYDSEHPDHERMRNWSGEFGYRAYDQNHINDMLKLAVHYKKTEWDKINHVNYEVIDNKYMT